MFPLGDENPTSITPFVNYGLIITNILVFLLEISGGDDFVIRWSFVPARFSALLAGGGEFETVLTIFTSMFMHAGIAHIFGNLLFLWIFGDNIEASFGHIGYLFFYLLCGVGAFAAQYFTNPGSTIPNLGASGAISGVLGAYLVMFPWARVRLFIWPFSLFIGILRIPALFWIGFWFYLQLSSGIQSLGAMVNEGGVAFWAHIGGFVSGLVLIWFFRALGPRQPPQYSYRR